MAEGVFGFTNPGPVEFDDEELAALITCVHLMQDNLSQASDDLSKPGRSEEDREAGRDFEKKADFLDTVRRKLGDEWEPVKEYRAPDTIEGLEDGE